MRWIFQTGVIGGSRDRISKIPQKRQTNAGILELNFVWSATTLRDDEIGCGNITFQMNLKYGIVAVG